MPLEKFIDREGHILNGQKLKQKGIKVWQPLSHI